MAKKQPGPVPDDLTREEQVRVWDWVRRKYPRLTKRDVRELVDACLSHHGARGNPGGIVDWPRACMNWVVNDGKFKRERKQERFETEAPREDKRAGPKQEEMVPIGNVVNLLRKSNTF